jgi:hypothetical protein
MLIKLNRHFARVAFFVAGVMLSAGLSAKDTVLSKSALQDKIKGAWAGQTIGVTYGLPVEFRYNSTLIPDSRRLLWYDGYLKETYEKSPGAYDDIYMDLSFVQVIENEGIDAPAQLFADAFAKAKFPLWFANQVGRYNILKGIAPPQSGHWLNNPAADAIDFQIEADFIGIMSPGMINGATAYSDKVGHIMNYGDGWYGGAYISALYSQAFIEADIPKIVGTALQAIPPQSQFHQVVADVIRLHKQRPDDWKQTWFEIHKKWSDTDLEPYGIDSPFNIDAKINAAWVVLGLLYGEGDFGKTLYIAAHAGDDADCNPSSAAGVLGAIKGYNAIPPYWKQGLKEVEDMNFANTELSLNDAYRLSYRHALQMIKKSGGAVKKDVVIIPQQKPAPLRLEVSFKGHYLKEKRSLSYFTDLSQGPTMIAKKIDANYSFDFDGIGFAVVGYAKKIGDRDYVFNTVLYVDGDQVETAPLPTDSLTRRFYLFWRYELPKGKHKVEIKLLNPTDAASVNITDIVIYDDQPLKEHELTFGAHHEGRR